MTPECCGAALRNTRIVSRTLTHRFTCQTATPFPGKISPPTRRPYRALSAKRVDRFSPSSMRGMTRRKAQLGRSRVSLRPCEGPCDPRIAFRRAIAAFLFEGPCFLGRGLCRFPRFGLSQSSRFRQSPVVGPDGDPRPPGSVRARHVRGRRIQTPLRKRPS
jgi:hypothetical protein